jgi:hypothetical protein
MSNRLGAEHTSIITKPWYTVVLAETRCVSSTLLMLARHEVELPKGNVGRAVWFADGRGSEVYRETAMRPRQHDDLVLLAVRFRLRFIGVSRLAHYVFRVESLLNTLLFAAHRGFQTKLWLTDRLTGNYRGISEWKGRAAAIDYLETLRVVLSTWVQRGSFAYEVIENVSRDEYLHGLLPDDEGRSSGAWWRPVRSAQDASRAGG